MARILGMLRVAWRVGPLVSAAAAARYLAQIAGRRGIRAAGFVHLHRGARVIVEEGATLVIGRRVILKHNSTVYVKKGAYLSLGDGFTLGHDGEISVNERVTIADEAGASPFVYITDSTHRFDRTDVPFLTQGMVVRPIEIGRNVWLARGVMVLPGARLPDLCVVGAGAIVTREHAAGDVVLGVPGRTVRNRFADAGEPAATQAARQPG
jgi:acetyltransferase-like isoleucine patch superfamily enzyme